MTVLPDRARPLLFAHRGCSSLAPENTMAAFRKARELGAPGLELDIHVCATGELVVAHDDNFLRTAPPGANAGGLDIEELPLREIRALDVGSFFDPAFSAERPPLLEEVLEEFCPDLYIDIELKSGKISGDSLPRLAAEKIRAFGNPVAAALTVSSFNPFCIAAFRRLSPHIPTAVIYGKSREVPWILRRGFGRHIAGCAYVKPGRELVGPASVSRIVVREKRPMIPWTIDDPAVAGEMLRQGCCGIISNRPQDMAALVKAAAVTGGGA
ncbi:MAG: glycerophosphodiester phosphodiesterase [Treponema sp.]|jgi:glycerophosphoryl diester phosphodiesterase|nr:glycerophosphodiester phosphodiesterase [Treponema sp.]